MSQVLETLSELIATSGWGEDPSPPPALPSAAPLPASGPRVPPHQGSPPRSHSPRAVADTCCCHRHLERSPWGDGKGWSRGLSPSPPPATAHYVDDCGGQAPTLLLLWATLEGKQQGPHAHPHTPFWPNGVPRNPRPACSRDPKGSHHLQGLEPEAPRPQDLCTPTGRGASFPTQGPSSAWTCRPAPSVPGNQPARHQGAPQEEATSHPALQGPPARVPQSPG